MGQYAEYLTKLNSFGEIESERKTMLSRISQLRGNRDVLVFASDFSKNGAPIGIEYADLLAIQDQLENMSGEAIDIILETPGGIGEVVEDIVEMIRQRYETVGMIIPGYAKSAGTIFAMAGDEILMGEVSSLGPIDGQLIMGNDKIFSADAFLEGLEKIKQEVKRTNKLSLAYVPILQSISPGEIQNCENIQNFSKHLVTKWLVEYKFKYWDKHSDGRKVTNQERCARAEDIAVALGSQSKWFTHARSIKIADLENLRIKITDYRKDDELNEAITRYYTLLRMSFESTPIYKIFETKDSQIYRNVVPVQISAPDSAVMNVTCKKCKHSFKVQINLKSNMQLEDGAVPYPILTDSMNCPKCHQEIDMVPMRQHIESQTGRKAVK